MTPEERKQKYLDDAVAQGRRVAIMTGSSVEWGTIGVLLGELHSMNETMNDVVRALNDHTAILKAMTTAPEVIEVVCSGCGVVAHREADATSEPCPLCNVLDWSPT